MLQDERCQRISALLSLYKRVSTAQIAKELNVSRETVRRDLLTLEALGGVKRIHGGVTSTREEKKEPPLRERLTERLLEKKAIGRQAALLLSPGQTIFVDTGSTTQAFAEALFSLTEITIITNSLAIASRYVGLDLEIQKRNTLIMLPGEAVPGLPAVAGATTVSEISRYRVDKAILSPVGISVEAGVTSYRREESEVARAMCDHAKDVVILADHSKIGLKSRISFCSFSRVNLLITNSKSSDLDSLREMRKTGLSIVTALEGSDE